MARPRGVNENPVSLFPFLSILACVIGTLILLITSVAISQMESQPEEELLARVEEYEEIEEEQQEMDDKLKTMLPKVHELEQYKEALKKLEKLAEELRKRQKKELQQNKTEQVALEKLLEQLKKLKELLAKEQTEKEKLQALLKQLEEELERRKMVVDAPTVCVMPAKRARGSKGRAKPVFVEADAKGLVLHPDGKRARVPTAKIRTDAGFQTVIDSVAGQPDKVIVFLLRDDGCGVYRVAESFARSKNAMVAKLPLIGKGKIDLSRF